jgi:hypothetical protein
LSGNRRHVHAGSGESMQDVFRVAAVRRHRLCGVTMIDPRACAATRSDR